MPIYYFHLREGVRFTRDFEGSDLPDLNCAIEEARQAAREIAADQLRSHEPIDGRRVEIADGEGEVLASVSVREVVG